MIIGWWTVYPYELLITRTIYFLFVVVTFVEPNTIYLNIMIVLFLSNHTDPTCFSLTSSSAFPRPLLLFPHSPLSRNLFRFVTTHHPALSSSPSLPSLFSSSLLLLPLLLLPLSLLLISLCPPGFFSSWSWLCLQWKQPGSLLLWYNGKISSHVCWVYSELFSLFWSDTLVVLAPVLTATRVGTEVCLIVYKTH